MDTHEVFNRDTMYDYIVAHGLGIPTEETIENFND